MTRWADLDSRARYAVGIFVFIVIILIILFWTGYIVWS